MIGIFLDGVGRSFFAVCFFLFLKRFNMTGSDEVRSIGMTTVFTTVMLGLTSPNTGFVGNLIPGL